MSNGIPNFIKVQRILKNNDTENVKIEAETININDIKGFRAWHKGKGDEKIEGEITCVMIKSENRGQEGQKTHMILINESYGNFEERVGQRTMVK